MTKPADTPAGENGQRMNNGRRKKRPLTSFVQLFEAPTEGMEPELMLRDLKMIGRILAARWRRFRGRD